jgi:hypothetical protein
LWYHESRKELVQVIIRVHGTNVRNVLIRPDDNNTPSGVDLEFVVDLPVAFVIGLVVDKYLPVVPPIHCIVGSVDFRKVENGDVSPWGFVNNENFKDIIVMSGSRCEPFEEGI